MSATLIKTIGNDRETPYDIGRTKRRTFRNVQWYLLDEVEYKEVLQMIACFINPIIDGEYRIHNKIYRCIEVRETVDDRTGSVELCSKFKRLYMGEYEEDQDDDNKEDM